VQETNTCSITDNNSACARRKMWEHENVGTKFWGRYHGADKHGEKQGRNARTENVGPDKVRVN